jgi:hypothetical protein
MTAIDWALYTERAVGRGSPNFADVVNRPLREVITISGADPDASFVGFSLVGHTHAATDIVSGTLPATRGGTGVASPTAGGLLVAAGALAMTVLAPGVAGRIVRDNGTAWAASAIVTADISDAASINTPSVAVKRDGSGNFSAGTITAALTGNASTATALATPRTINGVSFDGSGNITVTATAPNALTIGTHLTGGSYNGSASITIATDATALNTASTIVSRDGSGNFAAGTITASFTGPLTGTAALATALATPRNINGVAFDGTAPITVAAAASTLTGTTLASNVATSSLTAVGTLATGVERFGGRRCLWWNGRRQHQHDHARRKHHHRIRIHHGRRVRHHADGDGAHKCHAPDHGDTGQHRGERCVGHRAGDGTDDRYHWRHQLHVARLRRLRERVRGWNARHGECERGQLRQLDGDSGRDR